jgi:Endonuclease NucS C-terminal domain
METEIKIWEVSGKKVQAAEDTSLASQHLEAELEEWIANAPEVLGDNLLIIDRQREIPDVGRLDLLCVDAAGQLVLIELKRDISAREAVAQALDYASWLNDVDGEVIELNAKSHLGAELSDAFERHFGSEMPEITPQNHRIILLAARVDASAERIVNYLRERHGVELNVLLFKYAKLSGGQEILVRTVLLPESTRKTSIGSKRKPSAEDLLATARDRGVEELVNTCRAIKEIWGEDPMSTYGGSFRYWAVRDQGGFRMVFGVNVAGGRAFAREGKLDVWIRPHALSEVTGIPEENIRARLESEHFAVEDGQDSCWRQLSTREEAGQLIGLLREWARQGQEHNRT